MQATIRAPVRPTEHADRVKQAVLNLFPNLALQVGPDAVEGVTTDLRPLRQRVWELRIIDTFRGQFLHHMEGNTTKIRLSKQAALANHISFPPTPHVLGDIEVTIVAEAGDPYDIERLAWWMCPETKEGEIVGPIEP